MANSISLSSDFYRSFNDAYINAYLKLKFAIVELREFSNSGSGRTIELFVYFHAGGTVYESCDIQF